MRIRGEKEKQVESGVVGEGKRLEREEKGGKLTVALDELFGGVGVARRERRGAVGQQSRLRGDVALADRVRSEVGEVAVFGFVFFFFFVAVRERKESREER